MPTRLAAGTRTSSKKRVNCFSGETICTSMWSARSPGLSVGTTKRESWPFPVCSSTPVRVTTRMAAASSTPEM